MQLKKRKWSVTSLNVEPPLRAAQAGLKRLRKNLPTLSSRTSSEASHSACFQGNRRFFVACWLLRITVQLGFSAACQARRHRPRLGRCERPGSSNGASDPAQNGRKKTCPTPLYVRKQRELAISDDDPRKSYVIEIKQVIRF